MIYLLTKKAYKYYIEKMPQDKRQIITRRHTKENGELTQIYAEL